MTRTNTILGSTTMALTLAAGIASAQFPARPQVEIIIAARDSLEAAMAHLQEVNNASPAITRAKAYIALAHVELQTALGGGQGLQLDTPN